MAYVAVTGGQKAVRRSMDLLKRCRTRGRKSVELRALENRMELLIHRVMSEAGFYAPSYASLALKQSEGSVEEAVFLLRAYRSTLSRDYYSKPMDGEQIHLIRRISAAFKDVAGGQFLGATYDYTHRLLDFSLGHETPEEERLIKEEWNRYRERGAEITAPRVSGFLRQEGLITEKKDTSEPVDITQNPLTFPAPRSAVLQTLTRADTGYISGLAYAGIRGFGSSHPTVGELRTGELEVVIRHPALEEEEIVAGEILVTEVESFFPEEVSREDESDPLRKMQSGQGDKADHNTNRLSLAVGYGMVFGRNDTKAIAMSILDRMMDMEGDTILQNQEFVLLHGDCLEMNGFISHLKLPHYVTFQSKLDRVRHTKQEEPHHGTEL